MRTPGRVPLALPDPALAEAIADEWRAVGETIDPRAMPLTGLANAAIDRVAPDPSRLRRRARGVRRERPALLPRRGAAAARRAPGRRLGSAARLGAGALRRAFRGDDGRDAPPQPPATIARLGEAIAARSPFELAALSPIVTITGSLVAALALVEGAATAEAVWQAAELDEDWQAEQWGRDELSLAARDSRRTDFEAGARFLRLLATRASC